ncbi:hypothetical protein ABFB09_00095 [Dehalogenimonas sp. THU2]|uniref:bile acid:sodium symporter family protein n=1 Tax=Dehalogenimonas sp. THU2 TaxID=3151121 RepID=UPI003218DEF0
MAKLKSLLSDQHNFILVAAILLGLLGNPLSQLFKSWIIPLLVLAMTISLTRLETKHFYNLKSIIIPSLLVLLFNFIVLGGVNISLGHLLSDDTLLRAGFVVLATVPPSMTIPPFSYNLGSNVTLAYLGTTFGYLASIVILPVSLFMFFGHGYDNQGLFILIGQIIVLPLVLSRFYRKTLLYKKTQASGSKIINWCLAIVIFSLIGINRDTLFAFPEYSGVSLLVAFITIFLLGELIYRMSLALKYEHSEAIVFMLFGTMKKWAGASAITYMLFGPIAAIPPITAMIVGFIFYFWLSIRFVRKESP